MTGAIDPFDNPICWVYGELLNRHLRAARTDVGGARQTQLYTLIEAFREEFKEQADAWEAAHTERSMTPSPVNAMTGGRG